MFLRIGTVILIVSICTAGAAMLAGCGMELPHRPEFGFSWVSNEGKTQEQFYHDQAECRREVAMLNPPGPSGLGDRGWDMTDTRAFDECMHSKGWTKQ